MNQPEVVIPVAQAEPFALGEMSGAIAELQKELKDKGFDAGPVDGVYGLRTRAAYLSAVSNQSVSLPDGKTTTQLFKEGQQLDPIYFKEIFEAKHSNRGYPEDLYQHIPFASDAQHGVLSKANQKHAIMTIIHLPKEKEISAENLKKLRILLSSVPSWKSEHNTFTVVAVESNRWELVSGGALNPSVKWNFRERIAKSGRVVFPSTKGDFFLLAKSEDKAECILFSDRFISEIQALFEAGEVTVDRTEGFRHLDGRDLTGFYDGTRQPDFTLRALVDSAVINEEDAPRSGGSYVYAGQFEHNLSKFGEMSHKDKSEAVGREHDVIVESPIFKGRKENPLLESPPHFAHTERGYGVMYRQAWPYKIEASAAPSAGEAAPPSSAGLLFTAFARFSDELDGAFDRMAGVYAKDGSLDGLFSFTAAIKSAAFFAPSLRDLETLKHL